MQQIQITQLRSVLSLRSVLLSMIFEKHPSKWRIDPIMFYNRNELLMTVGGANGYYVNVSGSDEQSEIRIGDYSNMTTASDALFAVKYVIYSKLSVKLLIIDVLNTALSLTK